MKKQCFTYNWLSVIALMLFCMQINHAYAGHKFPYAHHKSPGDREAILKVIMQFEEAWAAVDTKGVAAQYTKDALFLPPGAPTFLIKGRKEIANAISGVIDSGISQIILETRELEIYRQYRTAYELGVFSLLDVDGSVVDCGPYLVIWKKIKGRWQLHRDIFNSSQSENFSCESSNGSIPTDEEPPGAVIDDLLPGLPGSEEGCLSDSECGDGSFCQRAEGNCDQLGQCVSLAAITCVSPDPRGPVCGCDGETYQSGCGVSVNYLGPCVVE